MKTTSIAWCDATFNPWWGCVKVSEGCRSCYAETFDRRTFGTSRHVTAKGETREPHWGKDAPRRFFGDAHWREPLKWDRDAENAMNAAEHGQAGGAGGPLPHRPRVFCASMADVFEDRPDLVEPRERLFRLILDTPNLDWQLLTKRPENVNRLSWWSDGRNGAEWPRNIWLGTTCEDQQRADERIPHMLAVPAAMRFLSVEPMLGPINLHRLSEEKGLASPGIDGVDWVIVGGESGHGARPFDVAWARSIVTQCREAGVACFVKQLGANPKGKAWRHRREDEDLCSKLDPKGGDPTQWAQDLRVREFPR